MQRLAGAEHHVVGDVHHVRDRALPGRHQALLEPGRRGPELYVFEHARGEAKADLGVDLDRDVVGGGVGAARLGVRAGGIRGQRRGRDGVQVARDSVDGHRVRPVGGDLELEHLVGDRQVIGQRCAGLKRIGEHHDAVVVLPDSKLVLGEDHAARLDSAQLCLPQLRPVGHDRPGQRHRDGLPGRHVRGAAHDRLGSGVAYVDQADAEPVGVWVLVGLEHPADDELGEIAHAHPVQALDLVSGHRQGVGDLLGAQAGVAVGAQPGERNPHAPAPNCSSSRRSLSKSMRRSGTS